MFSEDAPNNDLKSAHYKISFMHMGVGKGSVLMNHSSPSSFILNRLIELSKVFDDNAYFPPQMSAK